MDDMPLFSSLKSSLFYIRYDGYNFSLQRAGRDRDAPFFDLNHWGFYSQKVSLIPPAVFPSVQLALQAISHNSGRVTGPPPSLSDYVVMRLPLLRCLTKPRHQDVVLLH